MSNENLFDSVIADFKREPIFPFLAEEFDCVFFWDFSAARASMARLRRRQADSTWPSPPQKVHFFDGDG